VWIYILHTIYNTPSHAVQTTLTVSGVTFHSIFDEMSFIMPPTTRQWTELGSPIALSFNPLGTDLYIYSNTLKNCHKLNDCIQHIFFDNEIIMIISFTFTHLMVVMWLLWFFLSISIQFFIKEFDVDSIFRPNIRSWRYKLLCT